jgi:SAM-dependent methyltransferase
MRLDHFERLSPLCPACRAAGRGAVPLHLGTVALREDDEVIEGVLLCGERMCQREHPIIDGIPVLVADIASWAAHQLPGVLRRDDLSPFIESLLGDAAGPASDFHRERSNLGIYGWAHWGDLAPDAMRRHGGAYAALQAQALALLASPPAGLWLDLGCSVGRGTLELARQGADLAVGIDLNFAMLRVAERVRRSGRAVFALRREGVVFDRFDRPVPAVPRERISHWCCDVSQLPFADGQAAGALLLNLLDCVPAPLALLLEAGRVIETGGAALFSSPYDWSANATPMGEWLGGHSQRSAAGGASAVELRRVLSADCAAGIDTGLVIEGERDGVPWHVQTGERSTVEYAVHLARLRRR